MKNRNKKNSDSQKAGNKIMAMIGVPEEVAYDLPVTTITGTNRLEIDNYKNIVSYSRDFIKLNTTAGLISIEGDKLVIRQIDMGRISISGDIKSVLFETRG